MATILVVEDERDINNLVRRHLEEEGHRVLQAFDGPSALAAATSEGLDLVVLDWMLPRLDGLEVCRRVRRESVVPILMLTARSEEIDRVVGLEVGADEYLTKPFGIRELLARVRALLRRVELDRAAGAGADGGAPPAPDEPPIRVPPQHGGWCAGTSPLAHFPEVLWTVAAVPPFCWMVAAPIKLLHGQASLRKAVLGWSPRGDRVQP